MSSGSGAGGAVQRTRTPGPLPHPEVAAGRVGSGRVDRPGAQRGRGLLGTEDGGVHLGDLGVVEHEAQPRGLRSEHRRVRDAHPMLALPPSNAFATTPRSTSFVPSPIDISGASR